MFALRDIKRGEELTMDYGIRRHSMTWLGCEEGAILNVSEYEQEEGMPDGNDSLSLSPSPGQCSTPISKLSLQGKFTMEEERTLQEIFREFLFVTEITEQMFMDRMMRYKQFFGDMMDSGKSVNDIRLYIRNMF